MNGLEACLERLRDDPAQAAAVAGDGPTRLAVVLDRAADAATWTAASIAHRWMASRPGARVVAARAARQWPFSRPLVPDLVPPAIVWAPRLHDAFVNLQTAGTRLVTTQAAYLLAAWRAEVGDRDVLLLATADPEILRTHAREILERRGAAADAIVVDAAAVPPGAPSPASDADAAVSGGAIDALAAAFRSPDPAERLRLGVGALDAGRTPPALVAVASICMEVGDLDAAARDLDEALAADDDWPAAHFERGKLWLRADDMTRASAAFRAAAERLPAFASAWANLGATLGELDRPEEALAAFERALAADPQSHQALNNIGVVHRELGRLAESEAAFRRVIAMTPDLAFGHYNLGHTLFLQGRYQMALSAYAAGQARDRERNPVQATRLAVCRLACGDPAGALADLQQATAPLPAAYRRQLLADTNAIVWALLTHRPDLPGFAEVQGWLSAELEG